VLWEESLQRPGLLLAEPAAADILSDASGELFGAKELEEPAASNADHFGDRFPGRVAELTLQRAQRGRPVDRVEIVADDVFHQLLDQPPVVRYVSNDRGNDRQACLACRPQASLAMNHDVDVALHVVAHGDWLQDAFAPDAGGQLLQAVWVERAAGLVGVGLDPLQPDLLGGR
jgi:hypothetical protein